MRITIPLLRTRETEQERAKKVEEKEVRKQRTAGMSKWSRTQKLRACVCDWAASDALHCEEP